VNRVEDINGMSVCGDVHWVMDDFEFLNIWDRFRLWMDQGVQFIDDGSLFMTIRV